MRTALVTGAGRGVGRAAATALADAGYRVFATGQGIADARLPDSIVRLPCDHLDDDQTAAVFARIAANAGTLDVLFACAWGGYEQMVEKGRFTWPANWGFATWTAGGPGPCPSTPLEGSVMPRVFRPPIRRAR